MSGLSSVFPPPPWYYKHFTEENLEKLRDIAGTKEQNSADASGETSEPGLTFPLSLLVPPEPPSDSVYRSFGSVWQSDDKLQPLAEVGIQQLHSDAAGAQANGNSSELASHQARTWDLKKLLRSLLVNFIELLGIMSIAPEKFPPKTENIRVILINMFYLLNEYRPHQSRESLILQMEDQIAARRAEIAAIRESNLHIKKTIADLAQRLGPMIDAQTYKADAAGPLAGWTESKPDTSASDRDLEMWTSLE